MAKQYRLKAPTMEAIRAKIAADFAPGTRIISADRVSVGGLAGFFAEHHYEAVVEVPGLHVPQAPAQPIPARSGIADLLSGGPGEVPPAAPYPAVELSTSRRELAELLDGLEGPQDAATAATGPEAAVDVP